MSAEPALYQPDSKVLFLSICSLHKKKGGISEYARQESIVNRLSPALAASLLKKREEVRNLIWSGEISWGGIDTAELEYNNNLAPGADFGGNAEWAEYLPAISRYSGRFYLALGAEGKRKLIESKHHALFISGLYGLVTPTEPIQLYSCPLEGESVIQKAWTTDGLLTNVLIDYIVRNQVTRVFDLTSRNDYRNVIDWAYLKEKTGVDVLYCFTKMSAYDYALIEFGNLLREELLTWSEEKLLGIEPESTIEDVIFRAVSETREDLPKEHDIFILQKAAREVPGLPAYSLDQIPQRLGIASGSSDIDSQFKKGRKGWVVSFTSEFRKNLSQYNDKKLQGRVLEAVAEIIVTPTTKRGDTVKPLTGPLAGQWRYRIGDYRLIYLPDEDAKRVSLIAVRPRGNAYDD